MLSILTMSLQAQDVEARAEALGEALGKQYKVRNKGSLLIIEGFREGKQVKEDKVSIFDLDAETLKFSEANNTVSVKCYSELDDCVKRVLLLNKKKSYRKRLVFAISEGVEASEVLEKFRLLFDEESKKK